MAKFKSMNIVTSNDSTGTAGTGDISITGDAIIKSNSSFLTADSMEFIVESSLIPFTEGTAVTVPFATRIMYIVLVNQSGSGTTFSSNLTVSTSSFSKTFYNGFVTIYCEHYMPNGAYYKYHVKGLTTNSSSWGSIGSAFQTSNEESFIYTSSSKDSLSLSSTSGTVRVFKIGVE